MNFPESIELKLKAYEPRILDKAVSEIVGTISRIGARYKGPIPTKEATTNWPSA